MPASIRRLAFILLFTLIVSSFAFAGYPARSLAAPDTEEARSRVAAAFQAALSAVTTAMSRAASLASTVAAPTPAATAVPTPLAGTSTHRVALQVGHWKNNEMPEQLSDLIGNTGTSGGGRTEVDLNMDVANRVAAILRAAGVTVDVLPATVPTGYTVDAFVAIHADGNGSTRARGFKMSTRWRSSVALQDTMLVDMITQEYRAATGLPEDSAVTRNMRGYYAYAPFRPNYRVSNFTPGAIVEMGFMSNAADREVMFNQTDRVASGIAQGILKYLKVAYPNPAGTRTGYGYGIVDKDIDPNSPGWRRSNNNNSSQPRPPANSLQLGDWQAYLLGGKANVYGEAGGGGGVIAQITNTQPYHAIARKGDYYQVELPGGKTGWVHRNSIVIQT